MTKELVDYGTIKNVNAESFGIRRQKQEWSTREDPGNTKPMEGAETTSEATDKSVRELEEKETTP